MIAGLAHGGLEGRSEEEKEVGGGCTNLYAIVQESCEGKVHMTSKACPAMRCYNCVNNTVPRGWSRWVVKSDFSYLIYWANFCYPTPKWHEIS